MTFLVGARLTSPRAALLAACGMAASPVFLFHAVQPMSDVPATAWWMLAVTCALSGTTRWSTASGLATGVAILTRPNLAPIAGALLLVLLFTHRPSASASAAAGHPASDRSTRRIRRAAAFVLGALPAVVGAAWLNYTLYGHPLESGYGSASDLFSLSYVATNIARYFGWIADVHPIAAIAALLGAVLFLIAWRPFARPAERAQRDARPAILALAGVVAINVGAYLVYAPFENWTYLRFLLPSFPLVAIAAATALDPLLERAPRGSARMTATAMLCGLVVGVGVRDASARGVFERRTIDARHELLAHAYQSDAASRVFVTQQHGGAVLFHTGAPVVRWDLIDPDALDGAFAWFTARGVTPVILVDAEEEPVFRARFAGRGPWAGLDWPAHFETAPPQRARAYELPDRARFEAGARWSPQLLRR